MSIKKRTPISQFNIPVGEYQSGYYADSYFIRSREILQATLPDVEVIMQVFQRKEGILCGIDETLALLATCVEHPEKLQVAALYDGDSISPWETVLTIKGPLVEFIHFETLYLGFLSRQSKIATNVRKAVKAAQGKPVLFFPSRFDLPSVQESDGFAAFIGGVSSASTPANNANSGLISSGTIPHALIAAFNGDSVAATQAFDKVIDPSINRVALVDFDNDCVKTSLEVARALGDRLWGVRLDTSDNMVDRSLWEQMGDFKPTGVCPELIHNVRSALDNEGFSHVKILVSGGFNAERIALFEKENVPVDAYAVGNSFLDGSMSFTADIFEVNGKLCSKAGRTHKPNPRLEPVNLLELINNK